MRPGAAVQDEQRRAAADRLVVDQHSMGVDEALLDPVQTGHLSARHGRGWDLFRWS